MIRPTDLPPANFLVPVVADSTGGSPGVGRSSGIGAGHADTADAGRGADNVASWFDETTEISLTAKVTGVSVQTHVSLVLAHLLVDDEGPQP